MKLIDEPLPDLKVIQLQLHGDDRGFFVERYQKDKLIRCGITEDFVQDNHSRSAAGIIRGLHYQLNPAQGKLVGCMHGNIWDVAVDIRPESPTFGQHYGIELSDMNGRLLWIPAGFAHGFSVLGDDTADVFYKTNNFYNAASEGGIRYDDKELKIDWHLSNQPIISARDDSLPSFSDYRNNTPSW